MTIPKMKIEKRGGKRAGSGKKKLPYDQKYVTVLVPTDIHDSLRVYCLKKKVQFIKEFNKKLK